MGLIITKSKNIEKVIEENPEISTPIDEFEEYKRLSIEFDDIPNPPQDIQMQHSAHIDTIGRDRLATHPIEARTEELHHVHIWQEGCVWEESNGELKVQWSSTSDSYVVYSYFLDKDANHHFHVIDYCNDKAHELIKDEQQVLKWTNTAKEYRLSCE